MTALDALDPQQREAASTLRGPVAILAGAGTGKTRAITHRIAHGVDTGAYTPSRMLALTFTTKAAGELRGRLRALGVGGVVARTFHAAALSQLNYFWPTVAGDIAPKIIDNKVRLLAHAADTIGLKPDTATLRDTAAQIEWRKVTMRSIDAYAQLGRRVGSINEDALVALMRAYEKLKDERRQLDFEDVLLACAGMLEGEPRVAAAVREQYRHFTVDEYQDVSPLQNRLLEVWLGDRRDLCVVGDASQTIYSFTGADSAFLLDFQRTHPDARVIRLERNYRSDRAIVDVANALMRNKPGALSLVAHVDDAHSPTPTVTAHDSEAGEAEAIASTIEHQLTAGARPDQIAVLYRSHAQSAPIQQALAARGIAASVLGGKRFFDLPEVRQAVLGLRGAAVAPQMGGRAEGDPKERLDAIRIDTVRDVLRGLGHTDDPPEAGGALRDAWEARQAIVRLAEEAPHGLSLREFADGLLARAKDQHEPALRTVTLATIHAAKGLEWPHVHLAGLAEGLLPISYATTIEQIDEERRLAYVGMTRAAKTLSVTWARGTGRTQRSPSRFLVEVAGPRVSRDARGSIALKPLS